MSLHDENDLTRWNRAGLSRLRYIDGNAITYLETLREAAAEAFTEAGVNSWQALDTRHPVIAHENAAERQARWMAQYYDQRRDHGWEILRALARASHVLGEYIDTYANENLLRSCTEWDNLRRLVEMLDYHPSPPASAETWLAILAKDEMSGTLEPGFALKNKPADGSKASIFETLTDLDVSDDLNLLYPVDWNRSQLPFTIDPGTTTAEFPLEEMPQGVSAGNLGVLLVERDSGDVIGLAAEVSDVVGDNLLLAVEPPSLALGNITRSQVRLLLKPSYKQGALLTGDRVVELEPDHGLGQGQVVAWEGASTVWVAAKVEEVLGNRVRFSKTAPAVGTDIYMTAFSDADNVDFEGGSGRRAIIPNHNEDLRFYWASWDAGLTNIESDHSHEPSFVSPYLYDYFDGNVYSRVYYVPTADPMSSVVESAPSDLSVQGKPGDFGSGDWLLLETDVEEVFAAQVEVVSEGEGSYQLQVTPSIADARLIRGVFDTALRPRHFDRNYDPLFLTHPDFRSEHASVLSLDLPDDAIEYPALLEPGRLLCLDAGEDAMVVTVKAVDAANRRVTVTPAIPGSEPSAGGTSSVYTAFDTRVYANVVAGGHGESQAWKVLGSGDATRSKQSFVLDVDDVSFTVDALFPSGVRAALLVQVDGRTWTQLPSLNESTAEDHHYAVRVREDNTLLVQFGDGRRGRRLPSGNNNVQVSYRRGVGLAGNLDAFALEKAVKPHYLVDAQLQPLPATGGGDRESTASLRENAPESVLTLERAVSLGDFKHLAASNSGVWQAEARFMPAGLARRQNIAVAVVPAGGGPLGNLEETLKSYLESKATPGVAVSIRGYQSLLLDLDLVITVDESAFDPEQIAQHVCDAILDSFSLRQARLGASLYRSQAFAAVEAVVGVENCQCVINPAGFIDEEGNPAMPAQLATSPTGAIKRITTFWDQLVYADAYLSTINISTQALE